MSRARVELQLQVSEILQVTLEELDGAMFAGGEVLADAIRRHAVRRTGELQDSVYVAAGDKSTYKAGRQREKERKPPAGGVVVGASAFYAHFLESGVGPHEIRSRTAGRALALPGGMFARSVRHAGFPARPFVRPAYDEAREQAAQSVADALRKSLEDRVG